MVELDHHLSISSRLSLNSRILIRMSTNGYRVFFIDLFVVVNSLFNKGYHSNWNKSLNPAINRAVYLLSHTTLPRLDFVCNQTLIKGH